MNIFERISDQFLAQSAKSTTSQNLHKVDFYLSK